MNKRERFAQLLWFAGGALCGLAMLSISKAAIPPSQVTDDTAIYQNLSEIQVTKEHAPNFDADISRLSQQENRYQDKLPGMRGKLHVPMKRVAQEPYRYRGNSNSTARD